MLNLNWSLRTLELRWKDFLLFTPSSNGMGTNCAMCWKYSSMKFIHMNSKVRTCTQFIFRLFVDTANSKRIPCHYDIASIVAYLSLASLMHSEWPPCSCPDHDDRLEISPLFQASVAWPVYGRRSWHMHYFGSIAILLMKGQVEALKWNHFSNMHWDFDLDNKVHRDSMAFLQ